VAKQQPKPQSTPKKKPADASGSGAFTYLFRNLVVIIGIAFLFFLVDRLNAEQSKLPELYQEFQQLRQGGGNQQRLQELYNEIITIQSDTSFLKSVTRGYHWAIHDLAMKNYEQICEIKEQVESGQIKPLTREDKLMRKVAVYPLLKYVNESTPKDAVIWLPLGDAQISNDAKWHFIYDPEWTEYFIYPRLCIAHDGLAKHPELAKRITHVLIIEGKGYEKLRYDVPVEQRAKEAVLPINQPPVNNQ